MNVRRTWQAARARPIPDRMNSTDSQKRPPSSASPLFAGFARLVLRHRYLALLLNLGLTAYFMTWVPRLQTDTSYKALQVVDSEAQRVQDLLEDAFGADTGYVLIVEGDVFSMPYLEKLKRLHDELSRLYMDLPSLGVREASNGQGEERVEHRQAQAGDAFGDFGDDEGWGEEGGATIVEEIISLINVRDTRAEHGALRVGGLLDDWPPKAEDLPALRDYVMAQPSMRGKMASVDGHYSIVFLRTDFLNSRDQAKVDGEIRHIAREYESDGFHMQYSGMAAVNGEFNRLMLKAIGLCYALSIALMFALLVWTFRHPIGVLGPMLVVVQSLIWVMGLMAMTGTSMTLITTILPNFLTCVGIGDSVHILTTYRTARGRGLESHDAIVEAISHTGRPVVFTSITTAVGLLSFMFADLRAIGDLGLFGGFGVTAAMFLSLTFVPAMISFAPGGRFNAKPADETTGLDTAWTGKLLRFSLRLSAPEGDSMTRRNRVLIAASALTVVGLSMAMTLRVHYDPISWLPEDSETRQAFHTMDAHLGGSGGVQILVEPVDARGIRSRDLMLRLAKLEEHMLAYRDANGRPLPVSTSGLLEVIRESWWALHDKKGDTFRVPDSERGISDVLTMFENSGPEHLKRVTTIDGSASLLRMGMLNAPTSDYVPLLRHIERGVGEIVQGKARVQVTGTMRQMIESDNAVLHDMIRSFLIALAAITVLMVWMLGDLRLGLIAMVPNLLPLVVVLAFMVAMGIGVDMANLLVASIGIGLAVDDTIHFLHHFGAAYRASGDREHAIREAAGRAGTSIINTSVVLLGGFVIFMVAPLQNLVVFGELIAVTVVSALFIDIIFTPALLRLAYPAKVDVKAA